MSPKTPLRNNQPLAYQQARLLAMRGGVKGNISSCPANPFNFSAPSHPNYQSKAAGVTFFCGRASSQQFFNSSPELHFQPDNASNLSHLSAWGFQPNIQSSPTQAK
jgi:hypothetical protein